MRHRGLGVGGGRAAGFSLSLPSRFVVFARVTEMTLRFSEGLEIANLRIRTDDEFAMNARPFICIALTFLAATPLFAEPPGLLRMFSRRSVEADADKSYELSEEDGPWMILASTFVGEGAKGRAERLALEIRRDLQLPAFTYREHFDFTGNVSRRAEIAQRLRYANRYEYEAYAVLVGEYDTVTHPAIDRDLTALKSATPAVFTDAEEIAAETVPNNPVTALKAMHQKMFEKRKDKSKGPMAGAFVTRNPMLPEEYFDAPQVDSFVRQLNEGKQHCLLECEGKFTVVVKTFEGYGTIVDGRKEKSFEPSMERLDKFAEDADKMAKALRKDGQEAYQFHDRNRSLVTVGSFDTLGRELPDGGFEYDPAIREVMRKYSAFNADKARTVAGKGVAANHVAMIPFDVQPTPIAVPKTTKRGLFMPAIGMR